MKKISTLLMLFCAFVGTALAQLPAVSPAPAGGKWADGTKWYTIKLNNTNPIALSNADANGYLKLNSESTKLIDGCWCVVGDETNGYQFYNLQTGVTQTLGAYGSEANGRMKMYDLDVTTDGSNTLTKTFDIKTLDGQTGYAFVKNHGSKNDWWNERNGYLAYWNVSNAYATNCTGSQYTFDEVDVTAFVDEYKTKAKDALDMVSFLGVDDEKAAIDAVAINQNAFAAIDAIVNGVAQYVTFRNGETNTGSSRYNSYLLADMERSKGCGSQLFNHLIGTWRLIYSGDGSFYIYNVNQKVYLGNPGSNGALSTVPNTTYTLEIVDGSKVELKSGGQTLHLNNHDQSDVVASGTFLSNHDSDDVASRWYVETDFTALVETYKTTTLTTLDGWKELSEVFDGALVDAAKTAISGITITKDYATFAAIDAELKTVADAVANKMLTFQCTDTEDTARDLVYVAANASTGKAVGADNRDYNAVWTLQHAGGASFYLYNELYKVYLGTPNDTQNAVALTETPVVAYSFEWIENNKVELKCNGGTLHASNHGDDKLINYDGNQAASRWYVALVDVATYIQIYLDKLTEADYAEVPALGQYPKAAYDALVAAKSTATTVEEAEAAIATFKATMNLPVFTIDGVISYAAGKSIYDDNNAAPNFKVTNLYDKTMWWALDMTATEVGVIDEVGIYNVGTGNGFWGASSIKITETDPADTEDGIFLFYTTGNGTPIHYQNDNQVIVRWDDKGAATGSAHKFTYIGNTYDLAQLTDEKLTALAELEALYNAHKDAFVGEGLGKYTTTDTDWYDNFDAAVLLAEGILTNTLSEKATTSLGTITDLKNILSQASSKLSINLPVAGKYYRFQGACEASLSGRYITGHTNSDGGRIALTAAEDASTIYYFDGTNLIAYQSGLVIGLNNSHYTFASVDDNTNPASTITFAGSPRKAGTYTIKSANRYLHYKEFNGEVEIDRCQDDVHAEHDWYITEVTVLPVTITDAGYATFYAPVEVTLPGEVTAHTVTENGEWATLSDAISVVPANNGVILAGAEGTYNLTVSNTSAANLPNALAGTVAKTLVTKGTGAYYVLGVVDEEVGLYNPVKGDDKTTFYNAGHKAYWYIPAGSQTAGFRFGGNTTAIESVLNNGVDANAPVYDLSGRRVNNAVKGGIYIQNGKKFIVK